MVTELIVTEVERVVSSRKFKSETILENIFSNFSFSNKLLFSLDRLSQHNTHPNASIGLVFGTHPRETHTLEGQPCLLCSHFLQTGLVATHTLGNKTTTHTLGRRPNQPFFFRSFEETKLRDFFEETSLEVNNAI